MKSKGILQAINESISFWGELQRTEHDAISNCLITQQNIVEITEAVMFMNHEDKMKILNKYQKL